MIEKNDVQNFFSIISNFLRRAPGFRQTQRSNGITKLLCKISAQTKLSYAYAFTAKFVNLQKLEMKKFEKQNKFVSKFEINPKAQKQGFHLKTQHFNSAVVTVRVTVTNGKNTLHDYE